MDKIAQAFYHTQNMSTLSFTLRTPFYFSMCHVAKPFLPSPAPQEAETRVYDLVLCCFGLIISPIALLFLGIGIVHDHLFLNRCYTYIHGKGEEVATITSCATWNICMLQDPLPLYFGGVKLAKERYDQVARKIVEAAPDLICLQEVSQEAAHALQKRLSEHYPHIYIDICPDPLLQLGSSLLVASKVKLENVQAITLPHQGALHRGALQFQASNLKWIATHLHPGKKEKDKAFRQTQLQKLAPHLQETNVLFGDLNMSREEYQTTTLNGEFEDTLPNTITATDKFSARSRDIPPIDLAIDYIACRNCKIETRVEPSFDTTTGLSDHHLLVGRIQPT
ncbi:MAG: hypothetical protein S4CHLAM102_02580 [Chlamydiia bacterium]|nr:hypothetical protein [Chlamydiia bacterium]